MSPRHEQRQASVVIRRGSELIYVNDPGLAREYLFADDHQGKDQQRDAGQMHEEPRVLEAIHALARDIQERLASTVGKHCPNLKDGIYWAKKQGIVTQATFKQLSALNTADSFIKHYTSAAGKDLIERICADCKGKHGMEPEAPLGDMNVEPKDQEGIPPELQLADIRLDDLPIEATDTIFLGDTTTQDSEGIPSGVQLEDITLDDGFFEASDTIYPDKATILDEKTTVKAEDIRVGMRFCRRGSVEPALLVLRDDNDPQRPAYCRGWRVVDVRDLSRGNHYPPQEVTQLIGDGSWVVAGPSAG